MHVGKGFDMTPVLAFGEVTTCIQCSAADFTHVGDVFHYAQISAM
jgi:hypothetical protein